MKTRPFIKPAAFILVILAAIFVVRCKTGQKASQAGISTFLNDFNKQAKAGNADSLLNYFENGRHNQNYVFLIAYLTHHKFNPNQSEPLARVELDVDDATIKVINDAMLVAAIPAKLSHDSVKDVQTTLIFTIRTAASHQYKIYSVDAEKFMKDYRAYTDLVRAKTMAAEVTYSPATLAAFKTAATLKTHYDTVVWFAHLGDKTYYYTVKGKWNQQNDIYRDADSVIAPYKMALVGPDLKEVIPAQYDLIHNINATFPGLVEVENAGKKGFYDLNGKIVVSVSYDQVFPLNDEANLAVLRNGDDYFYLKQDMTISAKVDLKISDFISKIKDLAGSFDLYKNATAVVTEYNSKSEHGAIFIPPSYMVDLNITPKDMNFKNPLRKTEYEEVYTNYKVKYAATVKEPNNWLEASIYSIRDYFLGGRSEFYDSKKIVITDKKNNRVFTTTIGTDYTPGDGGGEALQGACDVNAIKVINDSLFEVKSGAVLYAELYDSTKTITGGPYYHYYAVKNNKLKELPDDRSFGFTKYVKMDDSYLSACYNILIGNGKYDQRKKTTVNMVTPEMLRYMKNEVFADYAYKFKDKRWENIFVDMPSYNQKMSDDKTYNASVDDSLTVIDKYNINWITQKLNANKASKNTIAAR